MTCRKRQELLGNDYRDEESRSKKYLLCRLMIHSFLFCLLVCFVEIIIRIMWLVKHYRQRSKLGTIHTVDNNAPIVISKGGVGDNTDDKRVTPVRTRFNIAVSFSCIFFFFPLQQIYACPIG